MENKFDNSAFSLKRIATLEDVTYYATYLVHGLKLNFHPDDDFSDYLCTDGITSTFSKEEVEIGNRLMDECFNVCESNQIDVYEFMGQHLMNCLTEYRTIA
jgi:hypothetical protein